MVTRHEFLAELHVRQEPIVYLEIGVQTGTSLRLAHESRWAIGIDPVLQAHPLRLPPNFYQWGMTSDEYFGDSERTPAHWGARYNTLGTYLTHPLVDLAFIDGMHLIENALRDFLNVEKLCAPDAIIVFDDVLPRNSREAAREQCPGDWTGDVWKIYSILHRYRPFLELTLVDTEPTGLLVVRGVDTPRDDHSLARHFDEIIKKYMDFPSEVLPNAIFRSVLRREYAFTPEAALNRIFMDRKDLWAQDYDAPC